ncbi:hypothetical protein [Massilia sp. TS11]|uniref:hypothetical protein n=1 Tax=Massilia sp. TS11 TaxID=2908003 RepID=UPI001EDC7AA1|nr:hypothetical protein [Massilia sp. TS11]MCG2583089.1 hypothetical protein [Massilia sp. TS11]
MRLPVYSLICLACLLPLQQAQAWQATPADPLTAPAPPPSLLDEQNIRAAVRAAAAEQKIASPEAAEGATLRSDAYARFARRFDEAKVPSCLHPDGLKRQPTFIFGGLLALPFLPIAALRGKCN